MEQRTSTTLSKNRAIAESQRAAVAMQGEGRRPPTSRRVQRSDGSTAHTTLAVTTPRRADADGYVCSPRSRKRLRVRHVVHDALTTIWRDGAENIGLSPSSARSRCHRTWLRRSLRATGYVGLGSRRRQDRSAIADPSADAVTRQHLPTRSQHRGRTRPCASTGAAVTTAGLPATSLATGYTPRPRRAPHVLASRQAGR